jgi:hypothetical protein
MAGTKNSISSLLAQFLRLQKNSLEIINKLSNATTSKQDTVNVEFLDDNNVTSIIPIPSWGYIINEIKRLDSNIKTLSGLDDGNANVRNADGTVSRIYQTKPLLDPVAPSNLQVPSSFKFRSNHFFESFLNPLLFVSFSLDGQVEAGTKRVFIKRIIANTTTDSQKNYFDTNLKGRNDISDSDFMNSLYNQGITYTIDENPEDLPLQVIRYSGTFSVLRVFDTTIPVTVGGQIINQTVRKYKLDAITYKDLISSSLNADRQLKTGDVLMTSGGSKFEISNVDISESTVVLKRLNGYEPVPIGNNALVLSSEILSPLQVNVNIGHDERQAIFIKAINDEKHVTGSSYSRGVVFHSNEMMINTSEGIMTLDEFYKNQVADFGAQFLANTKEKTIPSVYGLTPNSPIVDSANFKVVQINKQITQTNTSDKFSSTVQTKVKLQNEIDALNKSIDQARSEVAQLVTTSVTSSNSSGRESLITKIDSLTREKSTKTALLQTVIQDLNNISSTSPEISESPKYRVRGFWPIPSPITDGKTGNQDVIQFRVRYRYLTKQGNSTASDEIKFKDNDGTERRGTYSNWVEYKTDIRKKGYNTTTKKYYWLDEDVQNADVPNINQLDIPITAGEKVEIKVASVSEAGWPTNPLESDFSTPITIGFPDELSTSSGNDQYVKQNSNDQILVSLQQDLSAKGLDSHLSTAFNSGDKYYAHIADTISSGFFDGTTGKSLDLYQKLLSMDQEIASLKALIAVAKGVLSVYVTYGTGANATSVSVKRGSLVELFAGYYSELLDVAQSTNWGKIISNLYTIELRNDTASPLELSSVIPGGQNTIALSSTSGGEGSADYKNFRKYDLTPISLTGVKSSDITVGLTGVSTFIHAAPFQSANSNSQFVYTRYKSVGFDEDLFFTPVTTSGWTSSNGIGGQPVHFGTLIPFDPTTTTIGSTNASIWSGTYSGGSPVGNGRLNEFCIHNTHPTVVFEATQSSPKTFAQLVKPTQPNPGSRGFLYPEFRHAIGFEAASTDTNALYSSFQAKPYQQLAYTLITSNVYGPSVGDNHAYPEKLGFMTNDEYLVGKYSCGAYLFMAPSSHTPIQVEGSTSLATKILSPGAQNGIVIPVLFQMRCQDKLGYVGGFRSSGTIRNITYTKKIGIDIKVSNEEIFSFDLSVSGSYTKSALASPTYSSYKDTLGVNKFNN